MNSLLTVELAERSYPIHFLEDNLSLIQETLEAKFPAGKNLAVVADEALLKAQGLAPGAIPFLPAGTPVCLVPSGETSKSITQLATLYDFFAQQKIDRKGAIIALGGGVVGDLAGYAAASWLRGVTFYQIPTTLLAMVDSSVGGKTGINIPAGKNLVGAFHQPDAVFISTRFLQTLPTREFSAGMAEVIKYGMLYDKLLFRHLLHLPMPLRPDHHELVGVLRRCCEIKAEIVRDDERETSASGGRALLNLGHTFAHAIENVAGYGQYLHGEAVAIGLVLATKLSIATGKLLPGDLPLVETLIEKYNLPTRLKAPLSLEKLMNAMRRDKKVRSGTLHFVVMESIGHAVTTADISPELVEKLWQEAGAGE